MAFDYSIPRDKFLSPLYPNDEIVYFYYDEHKKRLKSKTLIIKDVCGNKEDNRKNYITVYIKGQELSKMDFVTRGLLGWDMYIIDEIRDFQNVIKVTPERRASIITKLRLKIHAIWNGI